MWRPKPVAKAVYRWANGRSGGALGVVQDFVARLKRVEASHAAASLAYYAMFSLFPLLLAMISVGGFLLGGRSVSDRTVAAVKQFIPVSEDLIETNIELVLARRGTIGSVGVVGLLWSGTGALTVLISQIGRAWGHANSRSFVKNRLLALTLFGVLTAAVLLSLLTAPLSSVLAGLEVTAWGEVDLYKSRLWKWLSAGLPPLAVFLAFSGLYRWVPTTDVRWREALSGSVFTAVVWEGAKRGFAWYVSSSLVNYPLVYGSLGAVMALLFWIYVSSWVAILGAHLSAAVASRREGGGEAVSSPRPE